MRADDSSHLSALSAASAGDCPPNDAFAGSVPGADHGIRFPDDGSKLGWRLGIVGPDVQNGEGGGETPAGPHSCWSWKCRTSQSNGCTNPELNCRSTTRI